MTARVAINGMGRIGRALFRLVAGQPALELVAVNDLSCCGRASPSRAGAWPTSADLTSRRAFRASGELSFRDHADPAPH